MKTKTDNIIDGIQTMIKKNWLAKLVDSDDKSVSASTVFMIIVTTVGILLLTVPVIALLIEVYYTHTINTDLSGMAAYIGAVSTMFVTVGLTKGWSTWSQSKYSNKIQTQQPQPQSQPENGGNFGEIKD